MVEMVPVTARPPVENMAPSSGVRRVVPQVGQPAPRAMRPVIMPAFSILSELLLPSFFSRFLAQRKTMRPIRMPWRSEIPKTGSQLKNGWLMPKMPINALPRICMEPEKPVAAMRSKFEKPPANKFISMPKKIKAGTKPNQKRFSFVTRVMPLAAKTNSSNHFLQFI